MTTSTDHQEAGPTDNHRRQMSAADDRPILHADSLLAFEHRHPGNTPAKNEMIRKTLGITPVRYTVLLMRAAVSAEGIAADPVTARMVRERGEMRARARLSRVA